MKFGYLLLCTLTVVGCISCVGKKKSPERSLRPVKVVTVEALGSVDRDYTGVVEAETSTNLAFRVPGQLTKLNVDEGQRVTKGEIIAEIDPRDYQLQLEANKAAYLTAQSQLERNQRLLVKQAISKQDFEIAQTNFVRAQSAYDNAKNVLADTKLKAPFSGFIEVKKVENYQRVQAGESIVKLVDPQNIVIKFTLPESSISILGNKQTQFTVRFDNYKEATFKASLKDYVESSPDGSGIPVTLIINDRSFKSANYNIKPGFSCMVNMKLITEIEKSMMLVPLSAVFKDPQTGKTEVWVLNPETNTVVATAVELGALYGSDMIVVKSGLKDGEKIVTAGVYRLINGQKVTILK